MSKIYRTWMCKCFGYIEHAALPSFVHSCPLYRTCLRLSEVVCNVT